MAFAAEQEPTVLVTDFRVPAGEAWSWARLGLADLAVEELNAHGFVTVDRDLLSVAGAEHDRAASRSQPESLKIGHWLGASLLLSGEVEVLQGSRMRLTGALTRSETLEQVGTFAVEGDYKTELQALVRGLVAGLTKTTLRDLQAKRPDRENPIKPEALLFFQQGIDACVSGKPALAVGFFRIASGLDPKFIAAREWEAHAYAIGGLPAYAASLRTKSEQSRRVTQGAVAGDAAGMAGATQTLKRVVSVLAPVALGGDTLPHGLTALRQAMEEAVLACGNTRLYRPDRLAESVTESDRQLSLQFSRAGTSRYSRWLASDSVLCSVVEPLGDGKVALSLVVMQTMTASPVRRLRRVVAVGDVMTAAAAMVGECAGIWQKSSEVEGFLGGRTPAAPLTPADLSRLPDLRGAVEALDARMRNVASLGQHQELAVFFASHGSADLAVIEWDLAMRLTEASASMREDVLYDSYLWASSLLNNPAVYQAVGEEGRGRVSALRVRLVANFPVSAAVFMLRFMEADQGFKESRWPSCATNAAAAREALEAMNRARREAGAVPFLRQQSNESEARATLLFLQGAATRQMANKEGARRLLEQAQATGCTNWFFCDFRIQGDGVSAQHVNSFRSAGLDQAIKKELEALDVLVSSTRSPDDHSQWSEALAERIALLSGLRPSEADESARCLRHVIGVWNELPSGTNGVCPLGYQAIIYADKIREIMPAEDRLSLLRDVARAYLRVTGSEPDRFSASRDSGWIIPRLQMLMPLYRAAGFEAEGLAWATPYLGAQADARMGLAVLQAVICEDHEAVRLPFGTDRRSKWEVIGKGMPRCEERLHLQMIEAFGKNHPQQACEAAAQYWKHLALYASRLNDEDPEGWYRATTNGLACSRDFPVVPDKAERFVPRLAVVSSETDPLHEVVRIRQSLGLSAKKNVPDRSGQDCVNWYRAGEFYSGKGHYELSARAFRVFRTVFESLVAAGAGKSLPSDYEWSATFLEAKALAATGHPVEAAERFRRLSKDLGTRVIGIYHSNGMISRLPLGLLSAEEAQKLHIPESEWAEREIEAREVRKLTGWIEAAVHGDAQAKRELLVYGMESGKPLDLSLEWTQTVCGGAPAKNEDRCLRAIALTRCGRCSEAKSLLEQAKKANPSGRFELSRKSYLKQGGESTTTFYCGQVIHFWLARTLAAAGDAAGACAVLGEAMERETNAGQILILGKEFEQVTGQALSSVSNDPEAVKMAVLRCLAERGTGDREAQRCFAWEGVRKRAPIKDCLRVVDKRLSVKPDDADFLMLKSRLLQMDGKAAEAIPYAREVIKQDQSDVAGHYALGVALFDAGDTDGAVSELRLAHQCCARMGEHAVSYYRRKVDVSLLDALAKQAGRVVK